MTESSRAFAGRALRRSHRVDVAVAAVLAAALGGCSDPPAASVGRAAFVRTEVVAPRTAQTSVTLTGEVAARFRAELSFRVSGRVVARFVDVGAHVNPDDLLARLDPTEQGADLEAATAVVAAAEAQLRVARVMFERQKALIANGFTTRGAFDQAQEGLRTAEGSLEAANAELGTAKDALAHTELRAGAGGVIAARNLEAGQVVQAGQSVFTLAQDGERDAVFEVPESIFFGDFDAAHVSLQLVSDPRVTAAGGVREVSPALDPKSSTVRVKVAIKDAPAAMALGSPVAGTATRKPAPQIALPWQALTGSGAKAAVWIVDPRTRTASLKPVTVAAYEAQCVVLSAGVQAGDRVVVDGGKLLSSGQPVTYDGDQS